MQSHNGDYLIGARRAPMPITETWPPAKEPTAPITTRITRWRHNHLLIILVVLATLMLLLALISGTVLYFHNNTTCSNLKYRHESMISDNGLVIMESLSMFLKSPLLIRHVVISGKYGAI
ncbi:hypothetical protein NPIL_186021 [Nephila pilipes]|uniref:Uncharacterized protein n=1 Tax=Nephila pilipes TaxID=299642 RepID=A0A8X6SYR0_NEPPI|nr:hypothetical protein NPIL_186021 [Nephila pilipes]